MKKLLMAFFFLPSLALAGQSVSGPDYSHYACDCDVHSQDEWVHLYNKLLHFPISNFDNTGSSGTVATSQGPGNPPVWQSIPSSSNPLTSYRRPNIVWVSTNNMTVERGLDGTAGDGVLMFPDGTTRTETSSAFLTVSATNTASASQGGIRISTAILNDWYRFYGVKTGTTDWELVADTNDCVTANFAFLNSVFGSNAWACLNLGRFGDGSSNANGWVKAKWAGEVGQFYNSLSGTGIVMNSVGVLAATNSAASGLGQSYTAGMVGAQLPPSITQVSFVGATNNTTAGASYRLECDSSFSANTRKFTGPLGYGGFTVGSETTCPVTNGFGVAASAATAAQQINYTGFIDSVLGIGSNPLF